MGRRGPKPLTAGLLRLRGSRLASGRARVSGPLGGAGPRVEMSVMLTERRRMA